MINCDLLFLLYCLEELNECESGPCGDNGNCTDLVNGFNCTCDPGYTGDTCEIGESHHHITMYLINISNHETTN